MQVTFSLDTLKLRLNNSIRRENDDHVCMSDRYPAYLLVGFNEWFDSAKLIRIPLNKQCVDELHSQTFTITGQLPTTDQELSRYVHASIIFSLLVPIHSKSMRLAPQRHSKYLLCHLDDIFNGKTRYSVNMTNKVDKNDVLCSFGVTIHTFTPLHKQNQSPLIPHLLPYKKSQVEREAWRKKLAEECLHFKNTCLEMENVFEYVIPGTETRNVKLSSGFFSNDPNFNYLNMKYHKSNELYFVHMFESVMDVWKTEYSLPLDYDSQKFFWELSVYNQQAVNEDMHMFAAVNSIYLPDATVSSQGVLNYELDDWSENVNEGGDDCDGKANQGFYHFKAFQKSSPFKHEVLEELRKRCQRYEKLVCLASMNVSTTKKCNGVSVPVLESECHLTTVTIHKKYMFSAISIKHSRKIYEKDDETENDLKRLIDFEKMAGNLDTQIVNKKGEIEELPMVCLGEGTVLLYPYPLDVYSPHKKVLCKVSKCNTQSRDFIEFSGTSRVYQHKKHELITRVFIALTDFFVKHPKCPVNLPSLNFSTKFENKCTFEKGISITELFDPKALVMFPQSRLKKFKESMEILTIESLYKFGYCPLEMKLDDKSKPVMKSRISCQTTLTTPPNITSHERSRYKTFLPKDTRNCFVVCVPSLRIANVLNQYALKHVVVGLKYVELLPHITVYMVWIKINK